MPIAVIPVTGLLLGPIGSISQTDFPLVSPRQVNESDTLPISFGETFVLNPNNTYSSVAQYIKASGVAAFIALMTQGFDASQTPSISPVNPFALGIAKDAVLSNVYYPLQGGTNMPAGSYVPGMMVNGLTRGTISVQVNNGTPARAGAAVYIRTFPNPAIPAGVVGGIEATNDPTTSIFASPNVGNQGSGTIGSLSIIGGPNQATALVTMGTYTVAFTSATAFSVTDPQGSILGTGAVGTAFSTGAVIGFKITTGSIPFVAGDGFSITAITISTLLIPNIVFKTGALSTDPSTGKSAAQVTILERRLV